MTQTQIQADRQTNTTHTIQVQAGRQTDKHNTHNRDTNTVRQTDRQTNTTHMIQPHRYRQTDTTNTTGTQTNTRGVPLEMCACFPLFSTEFNSDRCTYTARRLGSFC